MRGERVCMAAGISLPEVKTVAMVCPQMRWWQEGVLIVLAVSATRSIATVPPSARTGAQGRLGSRATSQEWWRAAVPCRACRGRKAVVHPRAASRCFTPCCHVVA